MDVFSSPNPRRPEARSMPRLAGLALAAALPFVGAGCDWKAIVKPPAETPVVLPLKEGLSFSLRPSFLGVTGTVSDVIGSNEAARTVRVSGAAPGTMMTLDWE